MVVFRSNFLHDCNKWIIKVSLTAWLLYLFVVAALCQNQQSDKIYGKVLDGKDSTPIVNALVEGASLGSYAVTDERGRFSLDHIMGKSDEIRISYLGYQTLDTIISGRAPDTLVFLLYESAFFLDNITVTGTELETGSSTRIGRKAIEHIQAVSLADVFQLVPGHLADNPDFLNPQQLTLRQGLALPAAQRNNALGTQMVRNGIPFSNNADLQRDVSILNSSPGTDPVFSTVSGKGADLREWSADNIESVEVIRGIPSARYGDLTSGVVLVNTRIGSHRPEAILRVNPSLWQMGVYGSFSPNHYNTINAGIESLKTNQDLRNSREHFQRFNGSLAWQRSKNIFRMKQFLTVSYGYDQYREDQETVSSYLRKYHSRNWRFQWNSNLLFQFNNRAFKSFSLNTGLTYSSQQSYYQDLITRDLFPLSDALVDTTLIGKYGSSEYLNQTTVEGKPLNFYNRIEALGSIFGPLGFHHKWRGGTEIRYENNWGNGRQFDPFTPPRQNYSMGDRPESWKNIPGLNQLSAYVEDRMLTSLFEKDLLFSLGLRWDLVSTGRWWDDPVGSVFSPRINTVWSVSEDISIRIGWGRAVKSPTLSQLYPGKRYFDLVNFNYYARDPSERLVIITTRVLNLNESQVEPYSSNKAEAGIQLDLDGWGITLTGFYEISRNSITYTRQAIPLVYDKYGIDSVRKGAPPALIPEPVSVDTFFAGVDVPGNVLEMKNSGIEYVVDIPEWEDLNTYLSINGAWYFSNSNNKGRIAEPGFIFSNTSDPARIPLYEKTGDIISQRLNSSVRSITHLQQAGLVFSALWQVVWIDRYRNGELSEFPVAYMDRGGAIIDLTVEEAGLDKNKDLLRVVNAVAWVKYPPLHLINLKVTKEWRQGSRFSFYVNNIFNHRPLHWNAARERYVRRNPSITFGAEIIYKIK